MANNESENDSYTPQTPVIPPPNTELKGPAAPKARRVKPMVEGINAPVRPVNVPPASPMPAVAPVSETLSGSSVVPPKITLTNPERQLIDEPVMPTSSPFIKPGDFGMPQKIDLPPQKRKFPWNRIIWAILISLLAVSVVLGALFWYDSRTGGDQNQFFGLFPKRAEVGNDGNTQNTPAPESNPVQQVAPISNPVATTTPPAATGTAASAVIPTITQIKIISTPTGFLNVRSGPSTNSSIVAKVHPGDIYTYTEVKGGWYHIILNGGSSGWVISQYVEVVK